MKTITKLLAATLLFSLLTGCLGPGNTTYLVDYQVVGERSIKYIYSPTEESAAEGLFFNQSITMEICSIKSTDQVDPAVDSSLEHQCRTNRILRTQEYR